MLRIKVAEMPIDIEMSDADFMRDRLLPYAAENDEPAQMRLVCKTVEQLQLPEGEHLRTIRSATILRLPDGRLCHASYYPKDEQYYQISCYTEDFSDVEITVCPVPSEEWRGIDFEYAYSGFDFANRLSYLGGAVLHGSAIAYKGEGVIFSAPSGTGKSTHTSLWKQCFGDDVVFVNDDKPALRFKDGKTMMYGAPWSGKTDLNTNICVPLKAIVAVQRGEENSIEQLPFTDALGYIRNELVQPYHDEKLGEKLVDAMIYLAQSVPVYLLKCNMDPQAAFVARRGIFDE